MPLLRVAVELFRLFRPDAAIIAFVSYLVGVLLFRHGLEFSDFGMAVFLTLISTNFIYSYNCITDLKEDRITHPLRPLPAGRLKIETARLYAGVLLVSSIVGPLFLAQSPTAFILMEMLPVLGLLYSSRPFRLRRFPSAGVVIIATGLVIPLTLGMLTGGSISRIWPITSGLFLFCLAVVPLKALEEIPEDRATGRPNLFTVMGTRLYVYSGIGLVLVITWSVVLVEGIMRIFIPAISLSALLIVFFFSRKENPSGLYRTIILAVILEGLILALPLW